jgi:vitamin B12 transporter
VLRKICLTFLLSLSVSAFAADLNIKVVDPNAVPVEGARVTLLASGTNQAIAAGITSGSGFASFTGLADGNYSVRVLAAGFSPATEAVTLPEKTVVQVRVSIPRPSETVYVSATRTPVPLEETGAAAGSLDSAQLTAMQPVSAAEALRFLPGAVVADSGQLGGLASLFVRGGDSRYNKVIIDGVPVDDPGGTFNFGAVPMSAIDRVEFVRGPQSTLYGSDAMTSVVEMWTATGHTRIPEFVFGADGGNYGTAHGFASLAGALRRLDYDLFADQFNTDGHGPNDNYSNASQGGNLGWTFSPKVMLRLRARHSNSRTGVQNEWNFNGQPLLPPDLDQRARQNDFLASTDLTIAVSPHWQHEFTGFEYHHTRLNEDLIADRGCDLVTVFLDCFFRIPADINRAGFDYQGDYTPRPWAHTTFGYEFEDETGSFNSTFLTINSITFLPDVETSFTHGLRRNHAIYGQQQLTYKRLSFVGGARYVNNESFGERVVPHAALTFLLFRGRQVLSGTRLRFGYGEGIKEPRFEETFGISGASFPTFANPNLKPEQSRSLEAGFDQQFAGGRYVFSALYFNNRFRNQIDFETASCFCSGEYINVNKSFAQGAELEFQARVTRRISVDAGYNLVDSKIQVDTFALTQQGLPLLRRPKHSGSLLVNYSGSRWAADFGSTLIGPRRDSDFFVAPTPITRAAGYARFDTGGWYAINHTVTAYANLENLFNKHYEEVVGYPALGISFRAGLRFRLGGD